MATSGHAPHAQHKLYGSLLPHVGLAHATFIHVMVLKMPKNAFKGVLCRVS